jgi:hypothetical protein
MQQSLLLYVLKQLSDAAQVIGNLAVVIFVAPRKLLARVKQSHCKNLLFLLTTRLFLLFSIPLTIFIKSRLLLKIS